MGDAEKMLDAMSGGLANFFLILVGLMCLLKLLDAVLEIAKKWRKSSSLEVQRRDCDIRFASDKRRLDAVEHRIDDMQEMQTAMAFGVSELLNHELHNGNTEAMVAAEKRLKDCIFKGA